MKRRVLIVEDDKETRSIIKAALQFNNYTVDEADTLESGYFLALKHRPDLIILDLNLPDGNGLDLCDKLRSGKELPEVPIIALTGVTGLEKKRKGFNCGLDQYLNKPIEMEELTMWVGALLRRVEMRRGKSSSTRAFGDIKVDEHAHLVKFGNRSVWDLTKREFELFYGLVLNSPRIFSREEIISEFWRTVSVPNLVDAHIYNLRRKLPERLATRVQAVPGRGFRYFADK